MPAAIETDCKALPAAPGTAGEVLVWGVAVAESYGDCASRVRAAREAWPR